VDGCEILHQSIGCLSHENHRVSTILLVVYRIIGFLPSTVNTKQISGMIMGCLPSTDCYQVVSGISHQNMLRLCKVCNGVFFMKAWVYFWVDFGEIASWVYDVFYTQHSDRHQLGIHAYRLAICGIKPCHFEITEAISIWIETIKSDIR